MDGEDFPECVQRLGGYRAINRALESIMDGLMRKPEGFPSFQNEFVKLRYAKTKAIDDEIPPLIFIFTIEPDGDVVLQWVEEDYTY